MEVITECIASFPLDWQSSFLSRFIGTYSGDLTALKKWLEEDVVNFIERHDSNADGYLELKAILLGILLHVTDETSSLFTSEELFAMAVDEIENIDTNDPLCREAKCLHRYVKYGDPYYIAPSNIPISEKEWSDLPEKTGRKSNLVKLCKEKKISPEGSCAKLEKRLREWSDKQVKYYDGYFGEQKEKLYRIVDTKCD